MKTTQSRIRQRDNTRRECFVYDTEPETTFIIRMLSDQSIEA